MKDEIIPCQSIFHARLIAVNVTATKIVLRHSSLRACFLLCVRV